MTQNEKIGEKPDLIHLLNVIILYSNILTYSYPYNIVYTKLYPKFQSLPFWVHCETTQQLWLTFPSKDQLRTLCNCMKSWLPKIMKYQK